MRGNRYLIVWFLAASLGTFAVRAADAEDESIWTGLVFASKENNPKETPPELKKFSGQLTNIFGYTQYQLIGQHTELMDSKEEHWLIPSKDFCLLVNSSRSAKPGYNYRLRLQLYQEKQLLARMDARLSGQNLLFIRGPFYGDGQLLIVLVVR